jgi:biopolymer transport protein ExbD
MKFRSYSGDQEESVIIDLTSLVDVLFVLVLFFVVSTTFSTYSELEVNLPSVKPNQSKSDTPPVEAEINISATGVMDVRGRKVLKADEIPALIKQQGKENSAVPVLIKADRKVAHGIVIGVLDELKRGGFEQVAIATEAEETTDKDGA